MVTGLLRFHCILYSQKYWRELSLAVEFQIAVTNILEGVEFGGLVQDHIYPENWRLGSLPSDHQIKIHQHSFSSLHMYIHVTLGNRFIWTSIYSRCSCTLLY